MNAAEIAAALGNARPEGRDWRCHCPVCNHHNLTLSDGKNHLLLVKCFNGCHASEVLAELRRRNLNGAKTNGGPSPNEPETRAKQEARVQSARAKRQARIDNALDIWRSSYPATDTLVTTYLASRLLLGPPPPTVRLAGALWHKEAGARYPAMVGLVEHVKTGAVGIHLVYLNPLDASVRVTISPRKRSMGPVKGGAVRLAPAGPVLAVAEGIEDAWTFMQATGIPSWAAITAPGIRSFVPPPLDQTATLILVEDQDTNRTGQNAVADAARRLGKVGYQIKIARPSAGKDLNDALLKFGLDEKIFTLEDYQPEAIAGDWYSKCLEGSDGRTLCNVANALLALREDAAWQGVLVRNGMLCATMLYRPKPPREG